MRKSCGRRREEERAEELREERFSLLPPRPALAWPLLRLVTLRGCPGVRLVEGHGDPRLTQVRGGAGLLPLRPPPAQRLR